MKASTKAVDRGAHLIFSTMCVRCVGQGHDVWIAVDQDNPEQAAEEAAKLWLKMVETDDSLD